MKKLIVSTLFILISNYSFSQDLTKIELQDVADSKMYSLTSILGGEKSLVIFVDNDCPYVDHYSKRIKTISEYAQSKGIQVLFVNPHELKNPDQNSLKLMQAFSQNTQWKGRYFSDSKQQFVKLLEAQKMPEVFIVEVAENKIITLFKGSIDDNPQNAKHVNKEYTKEAIDQISRTGKASKSIQMVAMGCRIMKF